MGDTDPNQPITQEEHDTLAVNLNAMSPPLDTSKNKLTGKYAEFTSPEERRTATVTLKLYPSERERLLKIAAGLDITLSNAARMFIVLGMREFDSEVE